MKSWPTIVLVLLFPLNILAQEMPIDSLKPKWHFSAWAEVFVFPDQPDFFNPTFYARRGHLHLEARYNYEDMNTASLWGGYRFSFGKKVKFVFVPMGAVVFGNTNGLAPGLETEVIYKIVDFYAESEHVFDLVDEENNFFYMYSELAVRPIQPIRGGLIAQRTRLYETERELNRGFFAEYYYKKLRVGGYYFNPVSPDQFWILSCSLDF